MSTHQRHRSAAGFWLGLATALSMMLFAPAATAQPNDTNSLQLDTASITRDPVEAEALVELLRQSNLGDGGASLILGRLLLNVKLSVDHQRTGLLALDRAAQQGIVDASVVLGDTYRAGRGAIGKDPEKAIAYYEVAAEAGSNGARRALAAMLANPRAPYRDFVKAESLLNAAVAAGDIDAAVQLGGLFLSDAARERAGTDALALYARGTATGHQKAVHAAGDLLRRGGRGLEPDARRAFNHFDSLSRRGDKEARRKIADMYIRGELGAPDYRRGAAMLGYVGRSGDAWGYVALGDLFSRGEFAPVNIAKSIAAYESAGRLGLIDGLIRLGDTYRSGAVGFAADAELAVATYQRALPKRDRDSNAALLRLADLYRLGAKGVPADPATALAYYSQAADRGDNGARRTLASLLFDGGLGQRDPDRALALLEGAAQAGDGGAAIDLALAYARGAPGVTADYAKAKQWFAVAGSLGVSSTEQRLAVALIEGPLAPARASEGTAILADLVTRKAPGAAVDFAKLVIRGKIPGTRIAAALDLLSNAAHAGDREAGLYLMQLLRDGGGAGVRANLSEAAKLLDAIAAHLDEQTLASERVMLLSASASSQAAFKSIAALIGDMPFADAVAALRQVAKRNQNGYFYFVQQKLTEFDIYHGDITGIMTGATIDALRSACADAGAIDVCDKGPLTDEAVDVVAKYLLTARD